MRDHFCSKLEVSISKSFSFFIKYSVQLKNLFVNGISLFGGSILTNCEGDNLSILNIVRQMRVFFCFIS